VESSRLKGFAGLLPLGLLRPACAGVSPPALGLWPTPTCVDLNTTPGRDRDVLEWNRKLLLIYWFYGRRGDLFTTCRSRPTVCQDAYYRVYSPLQPVHKL